MSMVEPETRPSLMVQLKDLQDQQAWTQFVAIYEPLIFRLLRQRGLQDADAHDVTQQVILVVTDAVERWQPDGQAASFRRWLFSIARNLSLKLIQRGADRNSPARPAAGGTDMLDLLKRLPEPEHRTVLTFEDEYRNEIFQWAAEQVRRDCRPATWDAFWRSCVLDQPITDVASDLGMTIGNVYVARTRVIAKLRKQIEQLETRDHD